jgi:tape measure domain-containing protein
MKVGSVFAQFKIDPSQFQKGLKQAQDSVKKFADDSSRSFDKLAKGGLQNLKNGIGNLGQKMVSLGKTGALAIGGLATAVTLYGLKMGNSIQQTSIAFDTMLGSVEKRQKLMQEITDFAKNTPFERFQLIDASKQLLAMGVSADKIIPTMKMLGDVSAGVSTNVQEVAFVFGQVKAQGQAYTEDLNQFATRGIPIYQELAKVLGVSVSALRKGMTDGKIKVGFKEVEKAFANMTGEGGKFFNLMDKQSKSMGGIMSNIKDNFDTFILRFMGITDQGDVRTGSIFDIVSQKLAGLQAWLSANEGVISDWGSRVFTAIGSGINFVWDSIIAPTLAEFKQWFVTGGKEAIKTFISEAWNAFRDALVWFKNDVWPPVKQALSDLMNWMKSEEGKQAMRDTGSIIRSIGDSLKFVFDQAGRAKKALDDFNNSAIGKGAGAGLSNVNKIFNPVEQVKGIGGIFNKITGRATGGSVQAGRMYEVGERDKPEMLQMGGKQFMISGNRGQVMNQNQMKGDNKPNKTINIYNYNSTKISPFVDFSTAF